MTAKDFPPDPPEAQVAAHLRSLEERLLHPDIRKNHEAVSAILADDFREFGSSGRSFTKPDILNLLTDEASAILSLSDFQCTQLAADVALVTYRSHRHEGEAIVSSALRSSVWVQNADGNWLLRFHQGTRI